MNGADGIGRVVRSGVYEFKGKEEGPRIVKDQLN
jgi:hypothetical protein